jgi:hypothetical protein
MRLRLDSWATAERQILTDVGGRGGIDVTGVGNGFGRQRPGAAKCAAIATALASVVVPLVAQSAISGGARVTTKDIKKHVGEEVTACGRVATSDCEPSTGALVLDLDTPGMKRNGSACRLPGSIGAPPWAMD